MKGSSLLPAALLAMATAIPTAFAAPQDPARIDGASSVDTADVSATPQISSSSWAEVPAQQPSPDTVPQQVAPGAPAAESPLAEQWRQLTTRSPQDYEAAYGNANVRERLGRVYSAGAETNGLGGIGDSLSLQGGLQGLQGQDLQALAARMLSGQNGLGSAEGLNISGGNATEIMQSLQGVVNDISRQLMPALQDAKRDFDGALNQAASRRGR
jgi:hypothetical protein